jgi:hypothetical protein
VISLHNRTFPKYFIHGRLTKRFIKYTIGGGNSVDNTKNKKDLFLNVSSPSAGYWFSAAFVDNDYDNEKVKPDALRSNCSFYLTTAVNLFKVNDTIQLDSNNKNNQFKNSSIFEIYKYFYTTSSNINTFLNSNQSSELDRPLNFLIEFNLNDDYFTNDTNDTTQSECNMISLLKQSTFPDMTQFTSNDDFGACHMNSTSLFNCIMSVEYPIDNTIYYLAIKSNCNYTITIKNNKLINECGNECQQSSKIIDTFRFIGPTYYSVKYYFNSNYNRSNGLLIRNQHRKPYFIKYLVDLANNGGTLNMYISTSLIIDPLIKDKIKESSSIEVKSMNPFSFPNIFSTTTSTTSTLPIGSEIKLMNNISNIKVMVNICFLYNSMSNYNKCPDGYSVSTQAFTNIYTTMHLNIAYPMMGNWYLAIWKECFNLNSNQTIECPNDFIPHSTIHVVSDQCANDYCGDYGTCFIINSQLNLVSACKCTAGFRGYGCTDSTNAVSKSTYLASILFLTMSNLVFIFPILLALKRRWYIESLVYFYNMFFSTFYHACDSDIFHYCIFNYNGLQLADFISSYSSFVVTILSMAALSRSRKVFTYFVGLLACLSINLYDRFSYLAFIIFLLFAFGVTLVTWINVCYTKRRLHPNKKQLLKYYLPGSVLAFTGLLIYNFLQTRSNYWILHSIWHICMASSIVFFLPKRQLPKFNLITNVDDGLSSSSSSSASSSPSPKGKLKILLFFLFCFIFELFNLCKCKLGIYTLNITRKV